VFREDEERYFKWFIALVCMVEDIIKRGITADESNSERLTPEGSCLT
jgi:hypothetical protein